MSRLKAIYRSWAIPCAGRDVYYTRHRSEWLAKIPEAGSRRRAEQLYQQLDMLQPLRQQARRELLAESRKHSITAKLRQIPSLGTIRSALAVALIQTPHRFRTKRQLWTYSGLGLETRDSGEYHYVEGQVQRRKKRVTVVTRRLLHSSSFAQESAQCRRLRSIRLATNHSGLNKAKPTTIRPKTIARGANTSSPNQLVPKRSPP
jgi:transposase